MNRRQSLRALAVGTIGAGTFLSACNNNDKATTTLPGDTLAEPYGRTAEETAHNARLMSSTFFTTHEMAKLDMLCDMIIPADHHSGSASDAEVPSFIEFMVKDQPALQIQMRGGLRWIDIKSYTLFKKPFLELTDGQRRELIDLIAYPEQSSRENAAGVIFFNKLRDLTATGFFTSKIGLDDLQYMGNRPNAWDGVPKEVLQQYGLEYDEKMINECLKTEDRGRIMDWNEA